MVPAVASRPSTTTPSPPELVGLATCPSCHTEDTAMTNVAVEAGADWRCWRCGQQWDAVRLATVAAYGVWLSERAASSSPVHTTHAGVLV
jgi:hypothetical protein